MVVASSISKHVLRVNEDIEIPVRGGVLGDNVHTNPCPNVAGPSLVDLPPLNLVNINESHVALSSASLPVNSFGALVSDAAACSSGSLVVSSGLVVYGAVEGEDYDEAVLFTTGKTPKSGVFSGGYARLFRDFMDYWRLYGGFPAAGKNSIGNIYQRCFTGGLCRRRFSGGVYHR
ncbi:hypothetical protein MA16_Dca024624 [Dendrobium catenatum]|uniref:Uncharacterized protein n=1 Tax=Dendrobium catenatum TaxID=906689 RepID=A0A2I0VE96_9ASPA|nr:hypothetical protein MA16_Dca024624 [Dendrobium catenatum]